MPIYVDKNGQSYNVHAESVEAFIQDHPGAKESMMLDPDSPNHDMSYFEVVSPTKKYDPLKGVVTPESIKPEEKPIDLDVSKQIEKQEEIDYVDSMGPTMSRDLADAKHKDEVNAKLKEEYEIWKSEKIAKGISSEEQAMISAVGEKDGKFGLLPATPDTSYELFLEEKQNKIKKEVVDEYDTNNFVVDLFGNGNLKTDEVEDFRYSENHLPTSFLEGEENASGNIININNYWEKDLLDDNQSILMKGKSLRDKWDNGMGYESKLTQKEDTKTLMNKRIAHYKDEGYMIIDYSKLNPDSPNYDVDKVEEISQIFSERYFDEIDKWGEGEEGWKSAVDSYSLMTISPQQIRAEANETISNNLYKSIEHYVSADFLKLRELEQKIVEMEAGESFDFLNTSNEYKTLNKEYNDLRKELFDEGVKPLFNTSTGEYIQKHKAEIDAEVENITSNVTERSEMERNAIRLMYNLVAINKAMGDLSPDKKNELIQSLFDIGGELYGREKEKNNLFRTFDGKMEKANPYDFSGARNYSMQEDFKRMNMEGEAGNRLPVQLSGVPEGTELGQYYNEQLNKFLAYTKALAYNYDPASLEQTGAFDHFVNGVLGLVLDEASMTGSLEMADKNVKTFLSAMEQVSPEMFDEENKTEYISDLEKRAEDRTGDLITGGMGEFGALIATMALFKRPLSGGLRYLGGNSFNAGLRTGRVLEGGSKLRLATTTTSFTPYAPTAFTPLTSYSKGMFNLGRNLAKSPTLATTFEIFNAGAVELGAGWMTDLAMHKTMGTHEMGWKMWLGFGMGGKISQKVINKYLTPLLTGEYKNAIGLKSAYQNVPLFREAINTGIGAGSGTATAVAVELVDATMMGNMSSEEFAKITDPQKLLILFSQLALCGAKGTVFEFGSGTRKLYEKCTDEILGLPNGNPEAKASAKRQDLRSEWMSVEELKQALLNKRKALLNDPKYKDQQGPFGERLGTELAEKLQELEQDGRNIIYHMDLKATKERILKEKGGKSAFNKQQKLGEDLQTTINQQVIASGKESLDIADINLTPAQIEALGDPKVKRTIIEMAIGSEQTTEVMQKKAATNQILANAKRKVEWLDNKGFGIGETNRKAALELLIKADKLASEKGKLNSEKKKREKNNEETVTTDLALKKNKEALEKLQERVDNAEKENEGYLETQRMESVRKAEAEFRENYPEGEFKAFETDKEFIEASSKLGVDVRSKDKKHIGEGFFIEMKVNADGTKKPIIYINLAKARRVKNITVVPHEFLHFLTEPALKDPKIIESLVKDFKKQLSWEELQEVELKLSAQHDPKPVEWFTAFHDAIAEGRIEYKKIDGSSKWKKIGNALTGNIFKPAGFTQAEFKTGIDAYNYIQDYAAGKDVKRVDEVSGKGEVKFSKTIAKDLYGKSGELQTKAKEKGDEWRAAEGEKKTELMEEVKEINAEKNRVIEAEAKAAEQRTKEKIERLRKSHGQEEGKRIALLSDKVDNLIEGGKSVEGEYNMTKDQYDRKGIAKVQEALRNGEFDGLFRNTGTKLEGDNVFGTPWKDFSEMMADELILPIIKFDPKKNNSLSGYMNSYIFKRKPGIIDKLEKVRGKKSIDVDAGEGGSVKEMGAESGIEATIDAKDARVEMRSTAKNVVDLSETQQNNVVEKIKNVLDKQIPNILKGDYQFFSRKLKGGKPGPRVSEQMINELKKDILNEIPKAGGKSKLDYRFFIENKLAPELLRINNTNPELIRNRNWDIFYDEVGKFTYAEAVRAGVEERITNEASQRGKYEKKNPTPKEIADYFINEISRPNEGRLAIGKLLAEKIGKDALNAAKDLKVKEIDKESNLLKVEQRKLEDKKDISRLSENDSNRLNEINDQLKVNKKLIDVLTADRTIAEISKAVGVDPNVAFSMTIEGSGNIVEFITTMKGETYGSDILENISTERENLGTIISEINKIKNSEEIKDIYSEKVPSFMLEIARGVGVEKAADMIFGEAGLKGNVLKEIKKQWSTVVKQLPKLRKGNVQLSTKETLDLLENSYWEQSGREDFNAKELLGITESKDVKLRVEGLEQAARNIIREKWENGEIKSEKELIKRLSNRKYDKDYEYLTENEKEFIKDRAKEIGIIEFALQNFKNALASSGNKILDGSITRVRKNGELVLEYTGEKSGNRYSIFKNKSDLLEVLVKPVLGEKVFNDIIKIETTKKGKEGAVLVNGEKVNIKSFAQSKQANKKFLDLIEKQDLKDGSTLESKLIKALKDSKEYADINKDIIISQAKSLIEQLKNKEIDIHDIGTWLESITGDMTSPLRASYHVDSMILGESKNVNDYRYEHNPPVRTMQIEIARFIKGEITETQLREKFKDTSASIIPKYVDKIINIRHAKSKPLEYKNRFDRYLNEYTYGVFKEPIIIFENGKIKKIGEYQKEAYKAAQEVMKQNKTVMPHFSNTKKPKTVSEQIEVMGITDIALEKARELNKEPKKARVFDFDDTLATTDSRVIYDKPNTTGKPSSKLKAIVLAGAPGSGKSSVVKGLGLGKQGYKTVNQDISLEWAKKLVGLSEGEAGYDAVQRSVRSEMGALAKKIAERKLDKYTNEGTGVVLDGTGASIKATRAKIEALKEKGYDVKMVYVETSKETALQRNRDRKERSLKDKIVDKTWDSVNANKAEYAKEFGENFFEVNTDNLKQGEMPPGFVESVNSKLNATERGRLEAGGFAEHGDRLTGEGAKFDFSEFEKVIEGGEGPLLGLAKMINEAKGDRNMFVLTARPQEAAPSIHEFLKSMGLDIPIENITGLENGAPAAKAEWMVGKAKEGFNDFYFADDHKANVEAVQEALDQLPVKSKTQQAKPKELISDINKELNNIKKTGDAKFSMDTKRDLKWEETGDRLKSDFKVGNETYTISLNKNVTLSSPRDPGKWISGKGVYELTFSLRNEEGRSKMGIEGTGNAAKVLSIVSNAVFDFVKNNKVDTIGFTSGESSRTRLYDRLTKLWADKLGWKHESEMFRNFDHETLKDYDGGNFAITNPKSKSSYNFGETLRKVLPKAKFSMETKRDLKWDKYKRTHSDQLGQKTGIEIFDTEFDVNGKKYGIGLEQIPSGDFHFKGDFVDGGKYFDLSFAKLEERSLSKAQVKAMKKAGMNESQIRRAGFTMDTDITGTGNAAEILSIVSNGIFDFVKKNNIDGLIYSSGHTSRTRIYDTLTKFWAEKLGWERSVESYEDGTGHTVGDFTIAKPLPTATIVKNLTKSIGKELGDPKFSFTTRRDLEWSNLDGIKSKKGDQAMETRFDFEGNEYKIRLDRIDGPVGTRKYSLYFSKIEQRKAIVAKREGEYSSPAKEVGRIDITGDLPPGKSGTLLGIISNGVLDIVKKHNMTSISFSSGELSRTRLYGTMTKYWAAKLGWKHEIALDSDYYNASELGGGNFMISKPTSKRIIPSFENVSKPVREVLNTVDIKGRNQEALFSNTIDKEFNMLLEESSGVESFKEFSPSKAEVRGKNKGKLKFFLPHSAEDFLGLVYPTLAKGKIGEGQLKWYREKLFNPYSRAVDQLSSDRINLMRDFKALKKQMEVPKDLKKKTKSGFTNEQAVRVYLWNKLGKEVPGLSKSDLNELSLMINGDTKLQAFADQLLQITKGDGYSEPGKHWLTGNITTDLIEVLNTTKRAKYLSEWQENVKVIYSEKNLNKLEAIYGSRYREALENILTRMKLGRNRTESGNRLSNSVLNYINQAQGSIMFLNMKSGLLQTISSTNYINWSFNNPAKAGLALANFPQYSKDWLKIMNSDYLVDRRNGLKLNISENEIADAAKDSRNKFKAILNLILEKGYAPTKFADSFAIATGGATFFRNRVKDLMKRDSKLTLEEAEAVAFEEFREISEMTQQSSDPSKISSQQASDLGRVTLQFVNTPMQYTRLQKRAFQDLMAGRGDKKTHVSRIIYYAFMQNLWFNAMQQAVFAIGWDDGVDPKEEKRLVKTMNGMADSMLRGIGVAGMTVSVLKNLGIDIYDRSKKDRPEYSDAWIKLLEFSPAIKSKLSKIRSAGWPFDSKKRRAEIYDKGFSINNPAARSMAQVIEGSTAIPLDRLYQKFENLKAAASEESEMWQAVAMVLGWPEWDIMSAPYVKPQTDEEKNIEDPKRYKKNEQVDILKQHGLSDDEIKELNNEDARVKAILKAQKSNDKTYTPSEDLEKKEDEKKKSDPKKVFDLKKDQQVRALKDLGLSNKEIDSLRTEQPRVDKIMELKKSKGFDLDSLINAQVNYKMTKGEKLYKKLKDLNKADQVKKLKNAGLSDSEIKKLKYEKDRVEALVKLQNK